MRNKDIRVYSYQENVFKINYEKLKKMGIKCLVFDLDNTLLKANTTNVSEKVIKFIDKLSKDFDIYFITNTIKYRAKKIKKQLDYPTYYLAFKPRLKYLKKIVDNNYQKDQVVVIGDRLLTDMKMANKYNIKGILVDPLSDYDFFLTKIYKKIFEERLYRYLEKEGHLIRGQYYE